MPFINKFIAKLESFSQDLDKKYKIPSTFLKYATASVILTVPLYPKFPLFNIPGTYVAIRIEDILITIIAFGLIIFFLRDLIQLRKNIIIQAVLLFLAIGLLSTLAGIFLTKTTLPHIGLLHWARRIEYFIPLVLGMIAVKRKENIRFYIFTIMLAIFLVALFGVGQKHFNFPVITTQDSENAKGIALRYAPGAHLSSTFAGHYDLAAYLVVVIPITIITFFAVRKRINKILIFTIFLSCVWLLVNAASRISFMSYLIALITTLFLIKKLKHLPLYLAITLIITLTAPALLGRYGSIIQVSIKNITQSQVPKSTYIIHKAYAQDVLSTRQGSVQLESTPAPHPVFEDRSTAIRLNVEWPRAIRAFKKNPLLGTGYSSITLATDNDFLRALGEIGFLGFASFMLLLYRIFTTLAKKLSTKPSIQNTLLISALASFPAIMLNALFIDIFEASKFAIQYWLILGMALPVSQNKDD